MRYEDGDEIALHGMSFHARVGILPHEREHPQPIEIDLVVRMRRGDALLDYRRLYACARDALGAGPVSYLEDLASAIAARALGEPGVARARVAVRKPHVALGGPLRHAGVTVVRERGVDA